MFLCLSACPRLFQLAIWRRHSLRYLYDLMLYWLRDTKEGRGRGRNFFKSFLPNLKSFDYIYLLHLKKVTLVSLLELYLIIISSLLTKNLKSGKLSLKILTHLPQPSFHIFTKLTSFHCISCCEVHNLNIFLVNPPWKK